MQNTVGVFGFRSKHWLFFSKHFFLNKLKVFSKQFFLEKRKNN